MFKFIIKIFPIFIFFILSACIFNNTNYVGIKSKTDLYLPEFNFQNQNGVYVSDIDFKSELTLVTFMYSDCTTECPSDLNDLIYGSPILVNISFENPGPSSSITNSEVSLSLLMVI